MAYPVSVTVEVRVDSRNRLTTLLRAILAIPHMILVGPVQWLKAGVPQGLIAAAAYVLAVVAWFAILITGTHPEGIRSFCLYYLRWRTRVMSYLGLFTDEYPPFGDGPYPAAIAVVEPSLPRDRATIAVRLLLAIPQFVVLFFVLVGWFVTTVLAWFAIVFTGKYPPSFLPFGLGAMRWALRLEAYMLLLVDEYPPFALD